MMLEKSGTRSAWWDVAVARADLVRTLGLRHGWRRVRAKRVHSRLVSHRRQDVARAMWLDAAAEVGATADEIAPGLLEIRRGETVTRVRGQTTSLNDPVAIDVASYKPLAYDLLEDAGVPVPRRVVVPSRGGLAVAQRLLREVDAPCVVKPARGAGGEGVTGGVTTVVQLRRALRQAARFHGQALVERQVAGDSYRILLLDGVVLDVLRRPRPRLTGDGIQTIEELLLEEHRRRLAAGGPDGIKPFVADLDCIVALEAAGLGLRSVLALGEEVEVRTVTNYNGPRDIARSGEPLSEQLLSDARVAARALGLRFAGVDILTTDPTRDLRASGGVVLEANPVPGLTYHYTTGTRPPWVPVGVSILKALLDVPQPSTSPPSPHILVP